MKNRFAKQLLQLFSITLIHVLFWIRNLDSCLDFAQLSIAFLKGIFNYN
ncbi:MAG: hypothetical protein J5629_09005 [Muribaculaceae bacterium]|nr:hypothetical protein [Muribaculaceae bacterium]